MDKKPSSEVKPGVVLGVTEPRPFRPKIFLFRMLAAIFLAEAGFLAFAFWKCSAPIPGQPVPMVTERCPKLGERAETLFVAAVATTLSLLTGADEPK